MSEQREILNDAEVSFLLGAAEEPAVVAAPDAADHDYLSQTATMHGDLDQISLADIFQTLAMSQMEGVLRVKNPLEEREVFCRDGHVRILVPPRLTTRRLGQRLVQAGVLSAEQLRIALLEQRKEKLPLGQLLIRSGAIAQEDLDQVLGMQVTEDLFALFTWRHGGFEFFKGNPAVKGIPSRFQSCAEFEINSLLLEVARRSDEWQSILEEIASLDEIPVVVAAPESPEDLEPEHRAVLEGANGFLSYRQLAEQTTMGLFEFARAARDLHRGQILRNVEDAAMVAAATRFAHEGENQRAALLLQTLRDRPGDRSLEVIRGMAEVLQRIGERRFASAMLLEAAQRSAEPDDALQLARAARDLVPYDPGTLSFLRTVLVAHQPPESTELEQCTIDLLDALIDADLVPTAIEIVEDARRTGTLKPQILVREARARQRARDGEGAIQALLELAQHYEQSGDRIRLLETYEAVVRIDRSRRDIQKLLTNLKRTRLGRIVRVVAAMLVVGLIGATGFVWWEQHSHDAAVNEATLEIASLLEAGDRAGARARLGHWRERLPGSEAIEDVASRVAFAEAAERTRQEQQRRARMNERLTTAAEALGRGELQSALLSYAASHAEQGLENEVREVVTTRLAALLDSIQRADQTLRDRLPPHPDTLIDRAEIARNHAALEEACPPTLLRSFRELRELAATDALPPLLPEQLRRRIQETVAKVGDSFARGGELLDAYQAALSRSATQRRLDPLFKAAVAKEAAHDFAGALALYRELEQQPTDDVEMRTLFRDRVARNATIVRLLDELAAATKGGDFAIASQHLRALRMSFPDVPFQDLVRLPFWVRSEPNGATVHCEGGHIGTTPLLLARIPSQTVRVEVSHPGFSTDRESVSGDGTAEWTARLLRDPDHVWQHGSAIEQRPVATPRGTLLAVDRSGSVLDLPSGLGDPLWKLETEDLSGFLTRPVLHGELAIVGSLDGELRAIELANGRVAWRLQDLPCEVAPTRIGQTLLLATTDGRLNAIDLGERRRSSVELAEPAFGELLARDERVFAVGERGGVSCWSAPALKRTWQRQMTEFSSPRAALEDDVLVLADDQGHLAGLDAATGDVRWRRDLSAASLGQPTVANGTIWVATPERILRFETRTGTEQPAFVRTSTEWAGPATVIGERVVAPLRKGPLQVLDARNGQALYRLAGDKKSRVLAVGDRVLVSHADHSVHSYARLP